MKSLRSAWDSNKTEIAGLLRLSIPTSANYLLNRLVGFTSVLFVGHLGPAQLAAAALGGSLTNVVGLGLLGGLTGGMSTLCGQVVICPLSCKHARHDCILCNIWQQVLVASLLHCRQHVVATFSSRANPLINFACTCWFVTSGLQCPK